MLRRVALVWTDVSEELSTSIIKVTRLCELLTTLAVTSNRRKLRHLWQENGSVIYSHNSYWALPAPPLLGPSPAGPVTICYCLIWDWVPSLSPLMTRTVRCNYSNPPPRCWETTGWLYLKKQRIAVVLHNSSFVAPNYTA
jgi:hypothetical protein